MTIHDGEGVEDEQNVLFVFSDPVPTCENIARGGSRRGVVRTREEGQ